MSSPSSLSGWVLVACAVGGATALAYAIGRSNGADEATADLEEVMRYVSAQEADMRDAKKYRVMVDVGNKIADEDGSEFFKSLLKTVQESPVETLEENLLTVWGEQKPPKPSASSVQHFPRKPQPNKT